MRPIPATLLFLLCTLGASVHVAAQELAERFIPITDSDIRLRQKLERAAAQANTAFWCGYQFELRDDVYLRYDSIEVDDEGHINLTSGRRQEALRSEEDFKLHVLRALAELGDERARKALQKTLAQRPISSLADFAFFLQVDPKSLRVRSLDFASLLEPGELPDPPVFWFGSVSTEDSFTYLQALIEDDAYTLRLRKTALVILSFHKHPRVIPYLETVARSPHPREIRKGAMFWLGQIPQEASFDALTRVLDSESDIDLQERAVFSISQHSSERVVERLAAIANDQYPTDVREKAVFWLGQGDDEQALEFLTDVIRNADQRSLKEKAVFALSQHKSPKAMDRLLAVAKDSPDPEVRKKAIFWLGQLAGRKSLATLRAIAEDDPETEIKTRAVFAISQHPDREQALLALMDIARTNRNPAVRKKAIFWLSQSGDERVVDFFKEILTQ